MEALLSVLVTTDERDTLVAALEDIATGLYQGKQLQESITALCAPQFVSGVTAFLAEKNASRLGGTNEAEHVQSLIATLLALPVMTMTIAFMPSGKAVKRFGVLAKKAVGHDVVVDITCDPRIIAGVQITYKGRYKDMSVARTLTAYFAKKGTNGTI